MWTLETNKLTGEQEIVINGFEQGISDSPLMGLADMRNINNDSIPGIALCNYKMKGTTQIPISATFQVDTTGTTSIFLTSGTVTLTEGCSVKFTSLTGTGLTSWATADSTSNIYYLKANGTVWSSFNPGSSEPETQVTLSAGSGTVTTINMGTPKGYAIDNYFYYNNTNGGGGIYIIDSNGRVWLNDTTNHFYYLKGNTLTGGNGQGIVFYKNYLFVIRATAIDIYDSHGAESSPYTWTNSWETTANYASHYAKNSITEQVVYFCSGRNINNIYSTIGVAIPKVADFHKTDAVFVLPSFELASCLEEPSIDAGNGTLMYIGTSTSNYIYPWDKHSTGSLAPLVMPELGTYQMLNINKIVYILAGQRGNIYYTNGSSVVLFKTLPKQPSQTPYPNWTWGGIMSLNNNLCFGVNDTANTLGKAGGCWAVTLAVGQLLNSVAGSIRYKGQPSIGFYNANVLIPDFNGLKYYMAWYKSGVGAYGGVDYLDSATPTFSTNYESFIESDIIEIGTALQGKTFNTVEFKLDTPLVSGEKIRLSIRGDLSTAYTNIPFNGTTEVVATGTYKPLDGSSDSLPIQYNKWIQIKAELQTVSGGSFVRLRELRIR